MFSFVIKDVDIIERYKDLSMSCAYVLASVIERLYQLPVSIKWPNDVYLNGKKMCGILLESHMSEGSIDGIIIGIGTNVNQTKFPSDLIYPVTSIANELGHPVSMEEFRNAMFDMLYDYLPKLKDDCKDHILFAQTHDYLKGKDVHAQVKGEPKDVHVVGIQDDCSLRVVCDEKELDLISGEITFH